MIAIKQGAKPQKVVPNLLPCSIRHDGPVEVNGRYWQPVADADGKQTGYFRGRKLEGVAIHMPEGYHGAVLQRTEELLALRPEQYGIQAPATEGVDEPVVETRLYDQQATFDQVIVWGHEVVPDATEDAYVKGVQEWIGMAEALHSFNAEDTKT